MTSLTLRRSISAEIKTADALVPNSNKKIVEKNFNEDDAMEIIEIEFQDLEDWLKRETKKLKKDSYNIIDSIKVKQNLSQTISNLYDN